VESVPALQSISLSKVIALQFITAQMATSLQK
jgi:hypothetical protein